VRWLLNILKSRGFLISLGVILLLALVWFVGSELGWSLEIRLIGLIAVLLVCVIGLGIGFARANHDAAAIEQSIKQQAQQQLMGARPDRRPEIEQLQNQLETAIEKLKQSKLGRGRRGRAALYALPWYLFIGPPAAGKTTAIANSGLNFPLGTNRIRGVGGTRNCDWFFSDSAILLDTAGRYTTEFEDTEEWLAFLDTLKKHRPERPVNGVIVGISIPDLADASLDEIEGHADNIRRRLDELIQKLGVRFPVYLTFTKCDLIQGFVEFFGALSRSEREQMWGCTLDRNQQGSSDQRAVFETEFERLADALVNLRSEKLARAMKREERKSVYVFPLEFAALKDNVAHFVDRLFQPNPYQESAIFRGFYFTSGTQEGVPIDQVIQSIAQQFDLPPEVRAGFDPQVEPKSYFIKDLFTDVIIPDQYMVSRSSRAATRMRLVQAGVAAASVALLVLFVLGTMSAYFSSKRDLNGMREAALAAAQVRWLDSDETADELARMDQLRTLLEDFDAFPPVFQIGLSRRGHVLEPARTVYYDRIRAFTRDHPFEALEASLRDAARQPSVSDSLKEVYYSGLKTYLLVTDSDVTRLSDAENRTFVQRRLVDAAETSLDPSASGTAERRDQLERQIAFYVEGLRAQRLEPFDVDPSIVAGVRRLIDTPLTPATIYASIKRDVEPRVNPITLERVLQGRGLDLFGGRPEVSGVFTKASWTDHVRASIVERSEDPNRDDWVLGGTEQASSSLPDSEALEEQLTQLYFNEYAREWLRFLREVQYQGFGNLSNAARHLEDLGSSSNSPLLYVLARVSDETQMEPALFEQASSGVLRGIRRFIGTVTGSTTSTEEPVQESFPVERRFTALHDLRPEQGLSGGAEQPLYDALAALGRVSEDLNSLDEPSKTVDYAATVLNENGGNLAVELRSIQQVLSRQEEEVRRLFEAPVDLAWSAILQGAQQQLNQRWRSEVHAPFLENVAGRYPVDPNSGTDVPINDFEEFFRPQDGTVAAFRGAVLDRFLAPGSGPRSWRGRGITVSSEAARALQKAESVGSGLFTGGVMQTGFRLHPEDPVQPSDVSIGQITIVVEGTPYEWHMGAFFPENTIRWPDGGGGASLQVQTLQGFLAPLAFDGSWAWFRLLQEAGVRELGAASYEVTWPLEGGIMVRYRLTTGSSSNPFASPGTFFSFSCPESLQ